MSLLEFILSLHTCKGADYTNTRNQNFLNANRKPLFFAVTVRPIVTQPDLRLVILRKNRYVEEARESRELLLGSVSHELRTPLNGILGMLLTIKDDVDQSMRHCVDIAVSSANLLTLKVSGFIDYTEIGMNAQIKFCRC